MTKEKRINNAVGAIIMDNDQVLLVKRRKYFTDKWTLPVGLLEYGETAKECIVREVKEELGADFINPEFCCYNDSIDVLPGKHYIMLYFTGNIKGEICLDDHELTDYKWFPLEEALGMELGFEHSEALQKFSDSL